MYTPNVSGPDRKESHMLRGLEAPELLILAALILVLFAGPKLPEFARSLGASLRILRNESRSQDSESSTNHERDTGGSINTEE